MSEQQATCVKCELARPLILFPRLPSRNRSDMCQRCTDWELPQPNRINTTRECILENGRRDNRTHGHKPFRRPAQLLRGARFRASKLRLEFGLSRRWVTERILNGRCEVTGIPFDFTRNSAPEGRARAGNHNFAPSIDRIDHTKGYTEDNCRLVVWIFNGAKGVGTDEDVMRLARAMLSREGSQ